MAHIIINPSLSAAIAYNLFFNPQKFAEVSAILEPANSTQMDYSSEVEESTSTTTDSESHTHTVSLLEKLKAPKCSDLTRKCAMDQNFNERIANPKIF